jgi:SUMO ligase MMS21 Smc5/6 complex component
MKLSPKKQSELYDAVHQEIMNARIEVRKILPNAPIGIREKVDDILSDLCMKAPIAATKLFKDQEKRKA